MSPMTPMKMVSASFIKKKRALRKELIKVGKVGAGKTFIALVKGYLGVVILIAPKCFLSGGYIGSPIALILSAMLSTYCSLRLVEAGLKTRIMNFSAIGQRAFGKVGRNIIDVVIMLTQVSFIISSIAFVVQGINSVFDYLLGYHTN